MYDVFELIESELGLDRGTLCDEIAEDSEKVKNNLMSNKNFSENEIIIALNNLAYNGLLEINTVTSLGNMYGGKDKNTLIASGGNNNCPL